MTKQIGQSLPRLLLYLLVGMAAIAGSGFLISEVQAMLQELGHPLPRPIFLGVLGGGVVYVAKWAMDVYQKEVNLYRKRREDLKARKTKR